jgi:hypothetical protein
VPAVIATVPTTMAPVAAIPTPASRHPVKRALRLNTADKRAVLLNTAVRRAVLLNTSFPPR